MDMIKPKAYYRAFEWCGGGAGRGDARFANLQRGISDQRGLVRGLRCDRWRSRLRRGGVCAFADGGQAVAWFGWAAAADGLPHARRRRASRPSEGRPALWWRSTPSGAAL
jgi:hypothetical protein